MSIFKKRRPAVGAKPGSLAISDDAVAPRLNLISYSPSKIDQQDVTDLAHLANAHNDANVTWVDIQGFGDQQVIQQVGAEFKLHPLLLADVVNVPQRPKTETHEDQLLIIVRMVQLNAERKFQMEQVGIVVAEHYVLTFQERYGDLFDPVRVRLRDPKSSLRNQSAGYLAYAILDTVIDGYYPILEAIGDHLEELEDQVLEHPTNELLRELMSFKTQLSILRRSIWAQRDSINSLLRSDSPLLGDFVQPYLRDTLDHCLQVSEVIETCRETVTNLMSTYLSSVANRTNEVMKVLTVVSTTFIPLTFLAGIYGMNFDNMPELHYKWSYPLFWAMNLGLAFTMWGYFWWIGWLRLPRSQSSPMEGFESADAEAAK